MIKRSEVRKVLDYLRSEGFSEDDAFVEGVRHRFPDIGIELCSGPVLALWDRTEEGDEVEAYFVIIEKMH